MGKAPSPRVGSGRAKYEGRRDPVLGMEGSSLRVPRCPGPPFHVHAPPALPARPVRVTFTILLRAPTARPGAPLARVPLKTVVARPSAAPELREKMGAGPKNVRDRTLSAFFTWSFLHVKTTRGLCLACTLEAMAFGCEIGDSMLPLRYSQISGRRWSVLGVQASPVGGAPRGLVTRFSVPSMRPTTAPPPLIGATRRSLRCDNTRSWRHPSGYHYTSQHRTGHAFISWCSNS